MSNLPQEAMTASRHELAGYPAPWHSNWCGCEICSRLRSDEVLGQISRALERIAAALEQNTDKEQA